MKLDSIDKTKLTPMVKQYVEIKEENKDVILFFRLGDFYEMFFEDAILASRELELTLTGKNAGLDDKIPMCGVPHHSKDVYIERLVEKGYKVAICEQLEDANMVKGIVKRGIVQIISSGTVINTDHLDEKDNNYVASILDVKHAYILSYTDITTGDLFAKVIKRDSTSLISNLLSLNIKEVVLKESLDPKITSTLKNNFNIIISYLKDETIYYDKLYEEVEDIRIKKALKILLSYIYETQLKTLNHFKNVVIVDVEKSMKMDIHTKRNLELTETMRQKERQNSLFWLLDKTKTAMGSRCLKSYIEAPLIEKDKIVKRQNIVSKFLKEFILKEELKELLDEVYDLERLSGKIAFSTANARDMLQLKQSLKTFPKLNEILEKLNYEYKLEELNNLYNLLESSIYEEPPISIKEGYIIKEGYNLELDELKDIRKGGKEFIAKFEKDERTKTGIKNLKVGYNKVFGYYIEVSKGQLNNVRDEFGYTRKQTLSNCERYISPVLKEKEALILNSEEKIVSLEYNTFIKIRDEVSKYIKDFQNNSKIISEIDVLQSFATISEENNYIKPNINNDNLIEIKDARHPIVEVVSEEAYVPNDIYMDDKTNILLITGPNMAGKSTYMRQTAIISIMMQIGCFIPASSANMPIFDAVYTRIGASDDLVSGESTFMVEMNEANNAVVNATKNSLIIFDELGRGTATFDGMSLAQSIIEYIDKKIKAKTLFSTHYHELTDLEQTLDGLKNVHVSAKEEEGEIIFMHKVKDGSVDKSYGIHVAKLANLPEEITKRASNILKVYESKEKSRDKIIQESFNFEFEEKEDDETIKEIKKLDILKLTPIDAINFLYEIKEKIDKK